MIFNVYWPFIEFCAFYAMRFGYRVLDRGLFTCDPNKTNKITIQQYVELHSGPVFAIHYKYSALLNITFVTFMYGMGMPILFPIALISVLTLYMCEKAMLYYSYRQPPMYDEKLNMAVLSTLTYAPLLMLSVGYWQLSNLQLFNNDFHWKERAMEVETTGHIWYNCFSLNAFSWNHAFPVFISFWIFLLCTIFRTKFHTFVTTILPFLKVIDDAPEENLDNYFETLEDADREWTIKEEMNCRDIFNFPILLDSTIESIRKAGHSETKL